MSKYKITIIDQNSGQVCAEIVEGSTFPYLQNQYQMSNGCYGVPIKAEIVLDAGENETIDTTEAL